MASPTSPLPPPPPEHRRVAAAQFERANQVVSTANYDYGIRLLLSCCKLDPANLLYRQALRRTEKAKYHNNLRGSWFSRLTSWPSRIRLRASFRARDYLKVLHYAEQILTRNPWDVATQKIMAEAAEVLGLLDVAVWTLEQARQKAGLDPHLNRSLAQLYEKRGNFTQAIALWELVHKTRPQDADALQKIKNLAADDTIARGQYAAVLRNADISEEETAEEQPALTGNPPATGKEDNTSRSPALSDRLAREAAPLQERLQSDPTRAGTYLQLAALYRRANQLEQAAALLRQGLGPTGNAFELAVELADLDIEPFRRDLARVEEQLRRRSEDPELRTHRSRLRREIAARELELFRKKADRFPTEMSHRYEVGIRLRRSGQIDEAIKELQASRADPRHRWQSFLELGRCFKARNNWRLAQRNLEDALRALPATETASRKEILFELATGHAEASNIPAAIDVATELANIDFAYRNIGTHLDEWQARLQQARVPH